MPSKRPGARSRTTIRSASTGISCLPGSSTTSTGLIHFTPPYCKGEGDEGLCGGELVSARQEPHPMSFTATIRPDVGQSLIHKVSRLFHGHPGEVILDLFIHPPRAALRAFP